MPAERPRDVSEAEWYVPRPFAIGASQTSSKDGRSGGVVNAAACSEARYPMVGEGARKYGDGGFNGTDSVPHLFAKRDVHAT